MLQPAVGAYLLTDKGVTDYLERLIDNNRKNTIKDS